MRISKKQSDISRKNLTLNNMEQQATDTYETFFHDNLGPDFFQTMEWIRSICKHQ